MHEKMPDAACILIRPPDESVLADRLTGRGSEQDEAIRRRLSKAAEEIAAARAEGVYNHEVVNDDLEQAVREVVEIINKE